jgi:tRNA-splicing ligase RtcB (3'-phosphate/5'-hydroxy nucleic acid ligase)
MITVDKINVFAEFDTPEVSKSIHQFCEFLKDQDNIVQAALMPDCHEGYSVPIGAVFASKDVIYPSAVGYDIGCGMLAFHTPLKKSLVEAYTDDIFNSIYRAVPTGFSHNEKDETWDWEDLAHSEKMYEVFSKNGLKQLGTLGGGNHFIEIAYDEDDYVWVIVHSGSRNVGHTIATHYMKIASGDGKAREGNYGLKESTEDALAYTMDLSFCLEFALENRKRILKRVLRELFYYTKYGDYDEQFTGLINRNHNHCQYKDGLYIHRKGATHAELGMYGVIPGNMRDGSFIVRGLGNEDSLCSSSHGAGRVLGRRQAKDTLDVNKFEETMSGIKAKVSSETLDESPFAYKNIFDVMEQQKELVEIIHHVKPLINIKGVEKNRR